MQVEILPAVPMPGSVKVARRPVKPRGVGASPTLAASPNAECGVQNAEWKNAADGSNVQLTRGYVISCGMKNPFPGMNPWLEEFWRDVHASLLVYARDELNGELPPDLTASVDERLVIDVEEEKPRTYVPDVAISESWDNPVGPAIGPGGAAVEAAKPILVDRGEHKLRRLEIADSKGHLITVIELLSPSNKTEFDYRWLWQRKRNENLAAGLSFVEIDLVRAGAWTLPDHDGVLRLPADRVCHAVCVTRSRLHWRHEFYKCPLRERLPVIRIPLRRGERDAALDLQALVDLCYERGRYSRKIDYSKPPEPPLPPEESTWAREVLAASAA